MAFNKAPSAVPVAIADLSIEILSPDPIGSESASASYSVQVKHTDGSLKVLTGDLSPHLTTAQINGLLALMAALRVKAVAEILP